MSPSMAIRVILLDAYTITIIEETNMVKPLVFRAWVCVTGAQLSNIKELCDV